MNWLRTAWNSRRSITSFPQFFFFFEQGVVKFFNMINFWNSWIFQIPVKGYPFLYILNSSKFFSRSTFLKSEFCSALCYKNNFIVSQGRQVEIKRLKENRGILHAGDSDAQEIENQWRKAMEEKDAEYGVRENKLQEEINALKNKVGREWNVRIRLPSDKPPYTVLCWGLKEKGILKAVRVIFHTILS